MNDNRLIEYTPLQIIDDTCIIHKIWFYEQTEELQVKLLSNLLDLAKEFGLKEELKLEIWIFPIPHRDIHECPVYFAFMKIYKSMFIFDNFIHCFSKYKLVDDCNMHNNWINYILKPENEPKYEHHGLIYECKKCKGYYSYPECTIIYLNDNDLNSMIGLHIKSNNKFCSDNLDLIPQELKDTINKVLDIYKDDGAFVKTSLKSAKKNNKGLRITPCFTINDVFENLMCSKQVLQSFLFGCNLIIRRWIDIKVEDEFRVYILRRNVRAICQQSLTQKIENKLDQNYVIEKITKFYNSLNLYYVDCVIDLVILKDQVKLIEINSGGVWSTAGSGLFNWKEIMETDNILFRYL